MSVQAKIDLADASGVIAKHRDALMKILHLSDPLFKGAENTDERLDAIEVLAENALMEGL